MPTFNDILLAHVMPAAIALVIGVLIAGRYRHEPAGRHRLAWAVALGVAYVIGHLVFLGVSMDMLKPTQARDWLIYAAPAALVLGALESRTWWRWFVRWPVRIVTCAAMVGVLLLTPMRHAWSQTESIVRVASLAAAMLVVWSVIAAPPARGGGDRMRALLVLLVCAAAALLLGVSGTTIYPMLAGNVVASMTALLILAGWRDGFDGLAGAAPFIAILIGGLVVAGWWYASVEPKAAILLGLALLPAWTGLAPHDGVRPWHAGWLVRLVVTLALLAAALTPSVLSVIEAMRNPSPYSY